MASYLICSVSFCFLFEDCGGNNVMIIGIHRCIIYRVCEKQIGQTPFEKLNTGSLFSERLTNRMAPAGGGARKKGVHRV